MAEGTTERINPSEQFEKTEPLEKAVELTQKFHHLEDGVNGTSAATQQSDDPQKQNQTD